jgi:hypothetical protein
MMSCFFEGAMMWFKVMTRVTRGVLTTGTLGHRNKTSHNGPFCKLFIHSEQCPKPKHRNLQRRRAAVQLRLKSAGWTMAETRSRSKPRTFPQPSILIWRPSNRRFLLRQVKDRIEEEEFDDYHFLVFDQPQRVTYPNDVIRFRVPVLSPYIHQHLLGYLPLPVKYYMPWVDLTYQIVFIRNAYDTLREALRNMKDQDAINALTRNFASTAAFLKYLLYARRMIMQEIFSTKGQVNPTLPTFDEFIIKYRFDYTWDSEKDLRGRKHIFKDPFDEEMEKHMGVSIPFSFPLLFTKCLLRNSA